MSHDFFNQSRREWSVRKHAVLSEYLPAFCRALSRTTRQHYGGTIWYVDGFAGAGRYDEDGALGSPLLALEAIKSLPYDIRCLNVEEDAACYNNLVQETAGNSRVVNLHGDFNAMIDEVLRTVQGCPALFFLDPFGMKDLPMVGQIEKIARRRLATDVLLRYDTIGISRVAGAAENTADPRSAAHSQSLDRVFRGHVWREIFTTSPNGRSRDDALLAHYLEQLKSIPNGRFHFAADYPIRSIEGRLKYYLVFATGDQLGIKIMSDVLRQAEASYCSDKAAHVQQQLAAMPVIQHELFTEEPEDSADQQQQNHIAAVQATLHEVGQRKKREWEFDELFYELLLHWGWFARLSEKDYRSACKGLAASGEIERISEGRAWGRGTAFRIVK